MECSGFSWNCYKSLTFFSLLTRCTIPCTCHAKRHLNIKKWFEPVRFLHFWLGNVFRDATVFTFLTSEGQKVVELVSFLHFWLRNVLRATKACTFSIAQLEKVVWTCCALYILNWKCALCHNGVHFLDMSTSKSAPKLRCFAHFDFQMCFASQRRPPFRHLNF